jgi:hypothetical protein
MKMRIQRIRFVAMAALLTVVVMAGVGCKKKIADPFPASGVVAGWEKSGKTQTFDAANLYEYIDGGAEQYISAGVVGVATSDYKFQGSVEATVDVYTMKAADGAKTIFEADPATSDSKSVQLGDAARLYGQSVVFRKGSYLVRITAFDAVPGGGNALLALAHGVEGRL